MSTETSADRLPEEARRVIDYWFGSVDRLKLPGIRSTKRLWFAGTPEIDQDLEKRFLPLMHEAALGKLDRWMETPEGAVALVVLLDQFSLNVYRDQPRSFTHCHLALPYALQALQKGYDEKVTPHQRVFLYMPLEHSEDIRLQEESVRRFRRLADEAPSEEKEMFESFHDYAERHERVIRRFGRFPDRNPILGRVPDAEEQAYMDAGGPDF